MTRDKFDKASELLKEIAQLGNIRLTAEDLAKETECVSIVSSDHLHEVIDLELPLDITKLLMLELVNIVKAKSKIKLKEFENL